MPCQRAGCDRHDAHVLSSNSHAMKKEKRAAKHKKNVPIDLIPDTLVSGERVKWRFGYYQCDVEVFYDRGSPYSF